MALETSDGLIDSVPVDVFQGLPSNSVPLCLTSKEISQDFRKKTVDLSLVHTWEQFPNALRYHVHLYKQTIVCKYKHHETTQPSYRLLEMNVLWRKVQINPRTAAKDLMKMLEETGTKASTVKRVLYKERKKPLLQNHPKKNSDYGLQLHIGNKHRTFWRNVLWSDETKIELFGQNDHRYVEEKEACKPKNTFPTVKHGGVSIML
uniref:Transposase n=1 Tax=Oncorhynchus tshawytscha TaxID=74940 RepID=A0AAZ3Q845_ONCTS